jgi:methionyl-tRNA synthetase
MDLARLGNKYFDESKPWVSIKTERGEAAETMYVCGEIIRMLSIVFYPVLPKSMCQLRAMMNLDTNSLWSDLDLNLQECIELRDIKPLFRKIEDEEITRQLDLLKQNSVPEKVERTFTELKDEIEYDDFARLDLRIVRILEAEKVPKTDKLLHLKVDLGGMTRELIAGIQKSYEPEAIIGKKVVMLANLKPRTMRGITSQGMILCALQDNDLSLLLPDKDVEPGASIS